jgi:plastocyanin
MDAQVGKAINLIVVNRGTKVHNLVIPAFYVFLPNLKAGESITASFTPDKAGRFAYYSDKLVDDDERVPESGMRGTLVVR